jgi:hypothetical protein
VRQIGALALFGVGLDHLEQSAVDHYAEIPTIGTLFVVNFVLATLIACALAAPPERLGRRPEIVLRVSGISVAVGSLAGLYLSEHGGLFGFTEAGYRPAILISITLELTTIVCLATAPS